MSLADEIKNKSKEIHSDAYSMSLGEIASLYRDGELRLHPEFQREFRWSETQKSNLIESVMLGIPIPPIFVVQNEDGVWDVIDGLQRLSTFFEFMGILKDEEGKNIQPSTLVKTKFLPSLEGKVWQGENEEHSFTSAQRIDFKRVKIGITIITKNSDPEAKYELFQRLNTGGSSLTAQEVRNCLMIMVDTSFYRFVKDLSENENFKETLSLSDRQLEEQFDMELVCRYFAGKNTPTSEFRALPDINEFVNTKMMEFAKSKIFDRNLEAQVFNKVFTLLRDLDVHPFRKYDNHKEAFSGMFLISTFEVIAIGLAKNINANEDGWLKCDTVLDKIKGLWSNDEFLSITGTGKSAKNRMSKCVDLGEHLFRNEKKVSD